MNLSYLNWAPSFIQIPFLFSQLMTSFQGRPINVLKTMNFLFPQFSQKACPVIHCNWYPRETYAIMKPIYFAFLTPTGKSLSILFSSLHRMYLTWDNFPDKTNSILLAWKISLQPNCHLLGRIIATKFSDRCVHSFFILLTWTVFSKLVVKSD